MGAVTAEGGGGSMVVVVVQLAGRAARPARSAARADFLLRDLTVTSLSRTFHLG
jgi:hypothetical protein